MSGQSSCSNCCMVECFQRCCAGVGMNWSAKGRSVKRVERSKALDSDTALYNNVHLPLPSKFIIVTLGLYKSGIISRPDLKNQMCQVGWFWLVG